MAFKFVVIVAALCIAQGFAARPVERGHGKGPCKNGASEAAKEMTHEFDETMHEMDDVRETVSMAAMDAYIKGNNPDVIVACFNEQKGTYSKLGQQIARMIKNASQEMAAELGDDYEKYVTKAEVPLKTIAITLKSLPKRMGVHIKNKEFGKALEVMRQSRRVVEQNSKILAGILIEMAEEHPEAAKKAEEMAREIRATARNGCKAIGDAFKKCVEEGGPKKPIQDDAEIEAEVEQDEQ